MDEFNNQNAHNNTNQPDDNLNNETTKKESVIKESLKNETATNETWKGEVINSDSDTRITMESNSNQETDMKSNHNPDTTNDNTGTDKNNESVPYSFWAEQISSNKNEQNNASSENSNLNNNVNSSSNQKESNHSNYAHMNQNPYSQAGSSDQYSYNQQASSEGGKVKKKSFFRKAVSFLCAAAVFGVVAGATFIGINELYYNINPDAQSLSFNLRNGMKELENRLNLDIPNDSDLRISTTTVSENNIQQKTDITDVVEATMPSIVTITGTFTQTFDWFGQQYSEPNEGSGSGIIVGQNDKELLIATNNHVVEGAKPIKVTFIDNSQAEAIVKGTDAIADLAVISIDISTLSKETLNAIKIAKLGDSDSVKVGQMAIAIGNALGYGQSVTVGYISAKDREVMIDNNTMVLLQTDAAINPGNSGGALLNTKGEVIGINSVKYASSEVEGMGYAIPISRAVPIINELMNREILKEEEKGYLGVYIEAITEEVAEAYNWPIGIYVREVIAGGSAEKAGIVNGDIITKVNGTEVTATTQLQEKISSYRAGTDVKLTIMRMVDGKYVEKEISVTLFNKNVFDKK